jgi:polysaccharide export outer membrane protein
MKLKILFIFAIPLFFFSCVTAPKNVLYFQDLDKYPQNMRIGDHTIYEPIIKNYDELLITVSAPVLDQEAVAQFNLPITTILSQGENNVQQSPIALTHIVDKDGAIHFPVIGRIALAGLSKSQAIERIREAVSNHVSDPIINLKIMSFKVTVLGEVARPGVVSVSGEKISILDAIGASGNLTIYGDRQNVWLLRENNDGTLERIRFDLTKADLFASPYYYLQQNDKIIVEPNKTRQLDSKYGSADGYRLSVFSMVFSAVSVIASTTIAIISLSRK